MYGLDVHFLAALTLCVTVSLGQMMQYMSPRQEITDMSNTGGPVGSPCGWNTPCAWGMYMPYTRKFIDYVKNTCKCPQEPIKCVKKDDDVAMSAYLYYCRIPDPHAVDPEVPPIDEFEYILPSWVKDRSSHATPQPSDYYFMRYFRL